MTESTDEEFEKKIGDYIDIESVLINLAIDDFLCNLDSFWWNWSNFYLYYNLWDNKFYLLTWDQDLALREDCVRERKIGNWIHENWWNLERSLVLSEKKENVLKWRLLSIPQFKIMYDNVYAEVKWIVENSSFSSDFFDEWNVVFLQYNQGEKRISEVFYLWWLRQLMSYLENILEE